ncbi:hypothetical protein [Pontiella sulfatireligans]|uniref:Uncharacterized protein n=1 Tax=Pontiella sulfatireligans TaxID=2750658 RepID=A0A6C2UHH9_9BACT|nr:hypothetical protein [Pontiella sulfatireligans]VGO18804.1 hypothetical protein SCARR_00857 [Pontiella sulfatireligans]
MAFKHCKHCAWGFEHDEWVDSTFCPNCGTRLGPRPTGGPDRGNVEHIEPYADVDPAPESRVPVMDVWGKLKGAAGSHPYLAGIGAVAIGLAAVWAAPILVTIGTAIVWIGAIITGCGFLSVAYVDRDEAMRWLEVGVLTIGGGLVIILSGYTLAVLGICSAAGGVGISGKAATEDLLKWNLRRKLDKMPIKELLALSRQMDA